MYTSSSTSALSLWPTAAKSTTCNDASPWWPPEWANSCMFSIQKFRLSSNLKSTRRQFARYLRMTVKREAWHLDERITAMINGANARLLSRFTGKDAHTEASASQGEQVYDDLAKHIYEYHIHDSYT